jgi:hypothetical protein
MHPAPSDRALESLIEAAPEIVHTAYGQLTPLDRMAYFWAAKDFYTGAGSIVDAGALVGASTCILAEGVKQNGRRFSQSLVIHVYDLFQDDADGYCANLLRGWYNEKKGREAVYDFEPHFRRNTAAYENLIRLYKGDITKQPYEDARGIEVLSIDVAKNADLMLHCAKAFFPKLIPGQSLILHQDYIYAYQPWLQVAMELMSDIVELVYDVPNHCTSIFAVKRAITEADIEARLGRKGSDFYHLGNVKALYAAIEKARPGFGRFVHTAALSYFYATMGARKTAIHVALRMLEELDPSVPMIERAALGPFLKNDLGIDYKTICR